MREGLVGLGHPVHFLALLDRAAAAFRRVDQLGREALVDHCGRPAQARATYADEEGSVLIQVERAIGLLDDRDLALFVSRHEPCGPQLRRVDKRDLETRFGFVSEPSDSLR